MPELFSVIVLLYNNNEFIEECLDSILIQDYPNIEVIVVDDCSEAFDHGIIEKYIQINSRENIRNYLIYKNECNIGTVKSANGAIRKSRGTFIKLLAADDALYDHSSLSNAAKALLKSPSGIITGDVMRCDASLKPIAKYRNSLPEALNRLEPIDVFRRLCVHNDIVAGGVFLSRVFFDRYGLFDESYRLMEDWPKWLQAVKEGCRFTYSPFYAIRYRSNGGVGTSSNPVYMADKKRVLEKIIIPAKREIGFSWYLQSRISYMLINSQLIRKAYAVLFR